MAETGCWRSGEAGELKMRVGFVLFVDEGSIDNIDCEKRMGVGR